MTNQDQTSAGSTRVPTAARSRSTTTPATPARAGRLSTRALPAPMVLTLGSAQAPTTIPKSRHDLRGQSERASARVGGGA